MAQIPTLEELLLRLNIDDNSEEIPSKEAEAGRDIQATLELVVSSTGNMEVGISIQPDISKNGLDGLAKMLFYLTNNPKAVSAEIASLMKDGMVAGTLSPDSITHVMKEWTRLYKEHSETPVIRSSEVSGIANMLNRHKEQ